MTIDSELGQGKQTRSIRSQFRLGVRIGEALVWKRERDGEAAADEFVKKITTDPQGESVSGSLPAAIGGAVGIVIATVNPLQKKD